jgi:hypothetical protein
MKASKTFGGLNAPRKAPRPAIGVKGKEVGGAFTSEDYARLKAMAEKYADLDQDF